MLRSIITSEQTQEFVGSLIIVFLTRYLMGLATPEDDWRHLTSWWASWWYLKFYRGAELRHQIIGMRLIADALRQH